MSSERLQKKKKITIFLNQEFFRETLKTYVHVSRNGSIDIYKYSKEKYENISKKMFNPYLNFEIVQISLSLFSILVPENVKKLRKTYGFLHQKYH